MTYLKYTSESSHKAFDIIAMNSWLDFITISSSSNPDANVILTLKALQAHIWQAQGHTLMASSKTGLSFLCVCEHELFIR